MVRPVDTAEELAAFLADKRHNAVVLGPGGGVGEAMRDQVAAALASEAGVVLDADALTSFAEDPAALFAAIGGHQGGAVLTPHEGEFIRLFSNINGKTKVNSKLERAQFSGPAKWRGRAPQRSRYGGGGTGRPGVDCRQCAALSGDRRLR